MCASEIEEFGYDTFTTVANSIENHYERILNYFVNRSTNAAAEDLLGLVEQFGIDPPEWMGEWLEGVGQTLDGLELSLIHI